MARSSLPLPCSRCEDGGSPRLHGEVPCGWPNWGSNPHMREQRHQRRCQWGGRQHSAAATAARSQRRRSWDLGWRPRGGCDGAAWIEAQRRWTAQTTRRGCGVRRAGHRRCRLPARCLEHHLSACPVLRLCCGCAPPGSALVACCAAVVPPWKCALSTPPVHSGCRRLEALLLKPAALLCRGSTYRSTSQVKSAFCPPLCRGPPPLERAGDHCKPCALLMLVLPTLARY